MSPSSDKKPATIRELLHIKPPPSRRKNLRLGMLHYHLRPGGVTSVMRDIANALRLHSGYRTIEIDVFASAGDTARALKTFEWTGGKGEAVSLRIVDIPQLAYNMKPYPSRCLFLGAAEALARQILEHIELRVTDRECPYILHSHNISLGKNPAATLAFQRIAEIAMERSLPLWLVNQVHDFAENHRVEEMRAFFRCSGSRDEEFARGFMYPSSGNIIYLTINSMDIANLLQIGISDDRIFLLPDPINVAEFEQKPLWKLDEGTLKTMGLPPADYREALLQRLADYARSTNQVFDRSLQALLSPMKVMRRKNNAESILLLELFRHLGRSCQLLVTLDAGSPPDIAYSRRLKEFAGLRNLPVLIGFGKEALSDTGKRKIKHGDVARFNLCDLHSLCSAIVTTSILEGFGFAYHEGWLSGKPVVGRKIADTVKDFENNGMDFAHMYDRIAVSLSDLPDMRERLSEAYKKKSGKHAGEPSQPNVLTASAFEAIIEEKFFQTDDEDCIDYADLSVEMQLDLIDRLRSKPTVMKRFIDRNPSIADTFRVLEDCPPNLIEENRKVVRSKYSLQAMARRLTNLFAKGDLLYRESLESVLLTPASHAEVMKRYRSSENTRVLF